MCWWGRVKEQSWWIGIQITPTNSVKWAPTLSWRANRAENTIFASAAATAASASEWGEHASVRMMSTTRSRSYHPSSTCLPSKVSTQAIRTAVCICTCYAPTSNCCTLNMLWANPRQKCRNIKSKSNYFCCQKQTTAPSLYVTTSLCKNKDCISGILSSSTVSQTDSSLGLETLNAITQVMKSRSLAKHMYKNKANNIIYVDH